jgi:Domain of unknown function (DUF222)
VTAELVCVIGEVLRAGTWEGFGIRSPEHWVVWRCGVSPGRARRLVRMARALDALPATNELFRAGSLGEDQTALIVRHTDAEHDAQVAGLAPSLTVPQLRRVLPTVPRRELDPDRVADDDDVGEAAGRPPGERTQVILHQHRRRWFPQSRQQSTPTSAAQPIRRDGRGRVHDANRDATGRTPHPVLICTGVRFRVDGFAAVSRAVGAGASAGVGAG